MENMPVFVDEPFDRLRKIDRFGLSLLQPAFDSGKIQNAVDIGGEAFDILDHEPDVFEPLLPGQLMFLEGFEIEFQ